MLLPARQAVIRWSRDSESERTVEPVFEKAVVKGSATSASTGSRGEPEAENRKDEKCARFHSLGQLALTHHSDRL